MLKLVISSFVIFSGCLLFIQLMCNVVRVNFYSRTPFLFLCLNLVTFLPFKTFSVIGSHGVFKVC